MVKEEGEEEEEGLGKRELHPVLVVGEWESVVPRLEREQLVHSQEVWTRVKSPLLSEEELRAVE